MASLFLRQTRSFQQIGRRYIVNPAINNDAARIFPALMPFGLTFVDNKLRRALQEKKVNVDEIERSFYVQKTEDYEFNNPSPPKPDSSLWGYIYSTQLIHAKIRLENLTKEEEFLRNYLTTKVAELTTRMSRYYSNIDWQSRYDHVLKKSQKSANEEYSKAYIDVTADIVSQSPEKYISMFKNNSFISKYDDDDKFHDYLPKDLDNKLTRYFEFFYDYSNDNPEISKYFSTLQEFENKIAPHLDAFSKNLRNNFATFLLTSFTCNYEHIQQVVEAIESSTSVIITDSGDDKKNDELVARCLSLLNLKPGSKVVLSTSITLSKLFFGNKQSSRSIVNKDVKDVGDILSTVPIERIKLVYKALQIQGYLNRHAITRVLISTVLQHYPSFFAQFLTNPENLQTFLSENSATLDNIVTSQQAFYETQERLVNQLKTFLESVIKASSTNADQESRVDLLSFLENELMDEIRKHAKGPSCWLVDALKESEQNCKTNGDIFGAIKFGAAARYLSSSKPYWYSLLKQLTNPTRHGFSGDSIERLAYLMTRQSSEVNNVIFGSIAQYLKNNGFVTASETSSLQNNISSRVTEDLNALRNACAEYDKARQTSSDAWKALKLNCEKGFHFDYIARTYNPLDIHLSQHSYFQFLY